MAGRTLVDSRAEVAPTCAKDDLGAGIASSNSFEKESIVATVSSCDSWGCIAIPFGVRYPRVGVCSDARRSRQFGTAIDIHGLVTNHARGCAVRCVGHPAGVNCATTGR